MTLKILLLCLLLSVASFGASQASQDEYEKSISAVVRNKIFYKGGRFELGLHGGIMPYDSLINHLMVGGRATWHLSDHFGWEIIDAQYLFPSVSNYTTSLVAQQTISNLQTQKIYMMFGTNFLVSPIYGKFRFLGASQVFFDMYLVAGGGVASTDTLRVATTGSGAAVTQTAIRSGLDPMFNFGLGFKVYLNHAMGIYFDMRDYVVYSEVYGSKTLKSNYSVFVGLDFFLPTF